MSCSARPVLLVVLGSLGGGGGRPSRIRRPNILSCTLSLKFAKSLVLLSESVFYKETSKIPFLFGLFLRLHQVHMIVHLILHVVHIVGTIMIESVIDGIPRGYNMGGMMILLNPLQFVLLYKGAEKISTGVEP